jgi:hypothetical protein
VESSIETFVELPGGQPMPDFPTLQDEYQVLVGELRQNREIQLQSLLTTPIWLSLFFGLVSAGGLTELKTMPILVLIPIPLVFLSLLLVVDRRGSSDRIIAYMRTAFEQRMATEIGWNFLLPKFRREVERLRKGRAPEYKVPQRPDFTMIVWASQSSIAATCLILYGVLTPSLDWKFWVACLAVTLAFLSVLQRIFRQSALKPYFVEAWKIVLQRRSEDQVQDPGVENPSPQ